MECQGPVATSALDICSRPTGAMHLCCYRTTVSLLNKEGVTQGDPLSMMLYAVAVLLLIHSLKAPGKWTQNWYADDTSCVADLCS